MVSGSTIITELTFKNQDACSSIKCTLENLIDFFLLWNIRHPQSDEAVPASIAHHWGYQETNLLICSDKRDDCFTWSSNFVKGQVRGAEEGGGNHPIKFTY